VTCAVQPNPFCNAALIYRKSHGSMIWQRWLFGTA